MTSSGDIFLGTACLAGLGAMLLNLLCAFPAHFLAYRRGYLRIGFLLGLYFGPVGILAASLLPLRIHPLVALENELCYKTNDLFSERWTRCAITSLLGPFFLVLTVALLVQGASLDDLKIFAGIALGLMGLSLVFFRRSQPPLHLLPPLPQLAEPGTADLLEWMGIRHFAAKLYFASDVLRTCAIVALIGALVTAFCAWGIFADPDPREVQRMLPTGVALAAAMPLLVIFALWSFSLSRSKRRRFDEMYFELFEADTHGDFSDPEPWEMEERIKWRYERIFSQLGHGRERALHFAVTTEEAVENTRRSLLSKPLTWGAGIWIGLKILKVVFAGKYLQKAYEYFTHRETAAQSWQLASLVILGLIFVWFMRHIKDRRAAGQRI